ncbi:E3 ubiquitin-protein ligase makorin-1 [Lepeophtheirus salmonis]|uniref:E3 ubiquitin-protein ligase makorin-1 n=1 Tax=Lepeophtheirus salmonis TaxID=72036 RepID=UPI001AE110E8|nr:probable E3 ubiquitin-protein ligase makorin-1 [Lepeophtheirus salmonis]XP_040579047.1 probable E3 ubiquitin-protein ligase makorin-1 [Lepeophtheirus salmonis]
MMASGIWTKKVLCRYFMNGNCANSQDCTYSHDPNLSLKKTVPCSFYGRGTCAYGDNCRFSHGEELPLPNETNTRRRTQDKQKHWAEAPEFVPSFLTQRPKSDEETTSNIESSSWAEAPEFKPSKPHEDSTRDPKSYADALGQTSTSSSGLSIEDAEFQICPYGMIGECRYGEHCAYIHGHLCDYCQKCQLHPTHEEQRRHHREKCIQKHEAEMEIAFAVARSKEKTCGICMEVVLEKEEGDARFGIMPNCNHCFCLPCLRTWRQAKQFDNKIVRSCPECRQKSDYICPSRLWVESKEDKDKLFSKYKTALNKKECKYFKKGQGECPFGNKCFYKHASADGKSVDVGPPQRRQRRFNVEGDLNFIRRFLLYDFLEQNGRIILPVDYFDFIELLGNNDEDYDGIFIHEDSDTDTLS